jgi:hypothetical protein
MAIPMESTTAVRMGQTRVHHTVANGRESAESVRSGLTAPPHRHLRMAKGPVTWNAPYRGSITVHFKDKEEGLFHVKQALS